ncbi:hypothetical protein LBMAG42_10050 [Deltaproteobacteria bacterium]|nr:hypothetical protein LBMAG42_10050 [Deltaproteobacteria bacterium]
MDPILTNIATATLPDLTLYAYGAYLGITVPLTVWVGRTLVKNGRIFLLDAFAQNADLADAVNKLLAVGFYLINLGMVARNIGYSEVSDWPSVVRYAADNVGWAMLVIGGMHFFNLFILSRMRKNGLRAVAPPPVAPNAYLPVRTTAPVPAGSPS